MFTRRNLLLVAMAVAGSVATVKVPAFATPYISRKQAIENVTQYLKNSRGIYDYHVVCDDTNNTAETLDQNQLRVDVFVKVLSVITCQPIIQT